MGEPTIYKPSIYNGAGIYNNGDGGGGGGGDTVEIGGKTYPVTTINGKKWLAKNLELLFDDLTINPGTNITTPGMVYNLVCVYAYGYLYNWWAAKYIDDHKDELIPGWRVARMADYQDIINFIGDLSNVPDKLYNKDWKNTSSDELGFNIMPAGNGSSTGPALQGISLNSGKGDFVVLDMFDSNKEYHFECQLSGASWPYNARGAYRSIRLIKDE